MPDQDDTLNYDALVELCERQLARDRAEWADYDRGQPGASVIHESIDSLSVAVACMRRRIDAFERTQAEMARLVAGDGDGQDVEPGAP